MEQPTLQTTRLILRPYVHGDAEGIVRISNNMNVVRWTAAHPFPYELKDAHEFLAKCEREWVERKAAFFACVLCDTGELIGGGGFKLELAQERGEIGYAIGASR